MQLFNRLTMPFAASVLTLFLTGCGGNHSSSLPVKPTPPVVPTPPPVVTFDYQALIDSKINDDIPGIVLLVDAPQKRFLGAAGMANLDSQSPMQSYHTMPTASSGKAMISVLAIKLAEEGLLDLDATIDTWLPAEIVAQIANAEQITVRQLLNHTSGIFNYVDHEAYVDLHLAEPDQLKTDIDFLPLVLNQPADFMPGQGYQYSNSGYLLAGLILDSVLGHHHSIALRERILQPLGLESTYYRGVEKDQGEFISGYHLLDDGTLLDTKPFVENVALASSPMVSSVEDMAMFLKSTITDDSFVSPSAREQLVGMSALVGVNQNEAHGLGLGRVTLNGHVLYAHAGLTYGYHTQNIYVQDLDTSMTLFINCSSQPVCENTMDAIVEELLAHEL